MHFEEPFILKRCDGVVTLRWDAVPTIFAVPNPPKRIAPTRAGNKLITQKRKDAEELTDHLHSKKKIKSGTVVSANLPLCYSKFNPLDDHSYQKRTKFSYTSDCDRLDANFFFLTGIANKVQKPLHPR